MEEEIGLGRSAILSCNVRVILGRSSLVSGLLLILNSMLFEILFARDFNNSSCSIYNVEVN